MGARVYAHTLQKHAERTQTHRPRELDKRVVGEQQRWAEAD